MSRTQRPKDPDPRRLPSLPERPEWIDVNDDSMTASESAETMMEQWTEYADRIDAIFRQMHRQTDSLDLTNEDYINFIRMFSGHTARPVIGLGQVFENNPDDAVLGFPCIPLVELHMSWDAFANELEKTYVCIARDLSTCMLRPGGADESMDLGDLDLSKLSLEFTTPSTRSQVRAILGSMLGPGRAFQAVYPVEIATQLPLPVTEDVEDYDSKGEESDLENNMDLEQQFDTYTNAGILPIIRRGIREFEDQAAEDRNIGTETAEAQGDEFPGDQYDGAQDPEALRLQDLTIEDQDMEDL